MRDFPPLPSDPQLDKWQLMSEVERYRYYMKAEPLGYSLYDFIRYQRYFAASDLAYIDHGLLESPAPEVIAMLERIAGGELGFDTSFLVMLWRRRSELDGRLARWHVLESIAEREAISERH